MGPLVPDLVSNELSILSALLVGIAFGFVLEQAGFSSCRRLAGLFYGYDFTVLRVFFTAAITAMIGLFLLGWLGVIDLNLIYIHPLYLEPALVGGAIMGLGFILGGYCPGTSVCAAAIGKQDAWVFLLGGFGGMFLYGEAYPLLAKFITRGSGKAALVYQSLGISRGLFGLLLVVAAVGAFAVTSWIEKRVNPDAPSRAFSRLKHGIAATVAVALGVLLLALPERHAYLLEKVATPAYQKAHPLEAMSVDELTLRLLDRDPKLVLIDLRKPEAFAKRRLPGAINLQLEDLFAKQWASLLSRRGKTHVFIDETGDRALPAALLADQLGYDNNRPLEGGMQQLQQAVLAFDDKRNTGGHPDQRRFRREAKQPLEELIKRASSRKVKRKQQTKRVKGGC